jgi:hypothetical protein
MLRKPDRCDVAALREKLAAQEREKEAARLDLRLSLRKLLNAIDSIPIDDAVDQLGKEIAGGNDV